MDLLALLLKFQSFLIHGFGQSLKKVFTDAGADKINPLFNSVLDIALTASDMDLNPSQSGYQKQLKDNFERVATSTGKASIEQKRQDFIKGLYSDNGAYFNQIFGPVNVKNQFLMRNLDAISAGRIDIL